MKSVSSRVPFRLAGLLLISAVSLAVIVDSGAQDAGKRLGFGSLFKGRPSESGALFSSSDKKSASLREAVMEALPEDRHYREVLAEAIVIAYRNRGFRNLWNHRQMPDRISINLSRQLVRHGIRETMALDPNSLTGATKGAPVNSRDLGLSIAIADAGAMVRLGAVPPESIWPDWDKGDRPGFDRADADSLAAELLGIASDRPFSAGAAVDSMASRNWIYRELQNGYVTSRINAANSSRLPTVPDPASAGSARPGEPYAHAAVLAENLALRGHLGMPFDERGALRSVTPELAEAIRSFQRVNGLSEDGIMGPGTWKFLATSPAEILRSRCINLHRARLLPDDFGKRYIVINLPSAELFAFDEGKQVMTMRIVHGRNAEEKFHTPIFRDVMGEVVFAPYWNVPESISVKEIFPKLKEDPTYLDSRNYEIVDNFRDDATVFELNEETSAKIETARLFLRQRPTSDNALGKVKFLLPNQFNIYLHDTPSKHHFTLADRAQSHGCVRLADPSKMAEWTLGKQGWDLSKIQGAMDAPTQLRVPIDEPVNVYVTYFTSFPRPGTSAEEIVLASARDVYKLDGKDAETLAEILP